MSRRWTRDGGDRRCVTRPKRQRARVDHLCLGCRLVRHHYAQHDTNKVRRWKRNERGKEGRTFETFNAGLEVGRLITKPSQIGGAITHLAVLHLDGENKLMKAGGEEKRYTLFVSSTLWFSSSCVGRVYWAVQEGRSFLMKALKCAGANDLLRLEAVMRDILENDKGTRTR